MKKKTGKGFEEETEKNRSDPEHTDSCEACKAGSGNPGETSKGGGGPWNFMTEREFAVLKAMRDLWKKAAGVKKRIRKMKEAVPSRTGERKTPRPEDHLIDDACLEQEVAEELLQRCEDLADLKRQWLEMAEERMTAQEERMRMLRHIQ